MSRQAPRSGGYSANGPTPDPRPDPPKGRGGASPSITELIERSSLGSPDATAARASVSDEQVAAVMRRVAELEAQHTRARDGARHLGHSLVCLSITMQAAAIAAEQEGPKAGMEWILNTLVESGMHPRSADDRYDDDLGSDEDSLVLPDETAQQFYDRQIARARADRDAT